MEYVDYKTVADGIGKQIDACLTALDQAQNGHKDPPKELAELNQKLTEAGELCGKIEHKAEKEENAEDPEEEG